MTSLLTGTVFLVKNHLQMVSIGMQFVGQNLLIVLNMFLFLLLLHFFLYLFSINYSINQHLSYLL